MIFYLKKVIFYFILFSCCKCYYFNLSFDTMPPIYMEFCNPNRSSYIKKIHYIDKSYLTLEGRIDQQKWFYHGRKDINSPCDPLHKKEVL